MTEFLNNFFGWPTLILLLIPVVILVRLIVRTSRWSILKMSIVTISGTLLLSSWFFFASLISGHNLGGEWGRILGQRMAQNFGDGAAFYLLSAGLIVWIITACMDLIVSGARYFINKPYIREIVGEVQKELEDEERKRRVQRQRYQNQRSRLRRENLKKASQFRNMMTLDTSNLRLLRY